MLKKSFWKIFGFIIFAFIVNSFPHSLESAFAQGTTWSATPFSGPAPQPAPPKIRNRNENKYANEPGTGTNPPEQGPGNGQGQIIDEKKNTSSAGMAKDVGDDILLNNGEMVMRVVDLTIPGRGFPYQFIRCYKSKIHYHGTMGGNWDHNYNMRLMKHRDSNFTLTGHMVFNDGLCRQELYVADAGGFRSPLGTYNKLTGSGDTYDLRTPDGMVYHFVKKFVFESDRLSLDSITDSNGNTMTFQYDANAFLTDVIDTLGRTIHYDYELTSHRLILVTDLGDPATSSDNRTISFTYDSTFREDLLSVTSPTVTGTSNGNNFPSGKTIQYTYVPGFFNSGKLYHNLETIKMPNEVAINSPSLTVMNTYGPTGGGYEFDKIIMQTYGGTNSTSVPAGGTIHYFYQELNPAANPNDITIPRNRTTVVDRVENVAEYEHNIFGQPLTYKEYTGRIDTTGLTHEQIRALIPSISGTPPPGKLRSEDPDFFETVYSYNDDAEFIEIIYHEGNMVQMVYDDTNPNRHQHGNVIEQHFIAGPRGGDGGDNIVMKYVYEPIFNQLRMVSDPRGLDDDYTPPIDPTNANVVGIDFDLNGTVTADEKKRSRYTSVNTFDYQEGNAASIQTLAVNEGVIITSTQAQNLSLNSDINGNGLTTQQGGNLIRLQAPTVQLAGGATQPITTLYGHNSRGQTLFRLDPDGSKDEFKYYLQPNPSAQCTAAIDADTISKLGCYLGKITQDTTTTDNLDNTALNITTEFSYDTHGNVISLLDPRGVRSDYEVNQLNQVIKETRAADVSASPETGLIPFAYTRTYFYDANDNVVQMDIQNKDGNTDSNPFLTTTYEYDILNNPIKIIQEAFPSPNVTTEYSYDGNENVTKVIQSALNFHEFVYDERDLLFNKKIGASDPVKMATYRYDYDGNQNIKISLDAEDTDNVGGAEQAKYTYDGFDRLVKTKDPLGNEAIVTYDPASNVETTKARGPIGGPSPTDNLGTNNTDLARGSAQYDELNRTIKTDSEWFLATGVAPVRPANLGDQHQINQFEYDRMSRLTKAINDNNHDIAFEYDGLDRKLRSVDELNNEMKYTYDKNSNVTRTASFERRGDDLVAFPEIVFTDIRYDSLNRAKLVMDNLEQVRRMAYDSRNNVTQTGDAQCPLDDPLCPVNDPELGLINKTGNTTRYFYDGLGRLTQKIKDIRIGGKGNGSPSLDGPADPNIDPSNLDTSNPDNLDGKITEMYTWDANSRLISVRDDKNNETSYAYDALNRLTLETFADTTTKQYQYDRDSNVKFFTNQNGSIFNNIYDGLNRLIERDIIVGAGSGTSMQTFEYDGLSRLMRATDNNTPGNNIITSFLYDSLSRQIEEIQDIDTVVDTYVTSSDFDGVGNRIKLTFPDNRVVNFTYDDLERLNTIPGVIDYSYVGPGRLLEKVFANGSKLTYLDDTGVNVGYEEFMRIIRHRHETSTDATIVDFTHNYNRENMRFSERRLHQPDGGNNKGEAYIYDSLYRLANFKMGTQDSANNIVSIDTQTAYNLDGVGNRTFINKDSVVTNYTPNNMNEYDAVGGVTHLYDANGNLIEDGSHFYIYDAFNRLIEVRSKPGNTLIALYYYDALNRRFMKVVDNSGALNGSTRYIFDGMREIEERDFITNTVLAQYTYGNGIDEVLTMDRGGTTYNYHDDSLGSIEALTDASNESIVERTTYDAYGQASFTDASFNPAGTNSSVDNPFLFTGRRLDPETGLYYYRNRYYSSSLGRFLERDPMDYCGGGLGLYEYGGGNPSNSTDPLGWSTNQQGSAAGATEQPTVSVGPMVNYPEPPPNYGLLWLDYVQPTVDPNELLKAYIITDMPNMAKTDTYYPCVPPRFASPMLQYMYTLPASSPMRQSLMFQFENQFAIALGQIHDFIDNAPPVADLFSVPFVAAWDEFWKHKAVADRAVKEENVDLLFSAGWGMGWATTKAGLEAFLTVGTFGAAKVAVTPPLAVNRPMITVLGHSADIRRFKWSWEYLTNPNTFNILKMPKSQYTLDYNLNVWLSKAVGRGDAFKIVTPSLQLRGGSVAACEIITCQEAHGLSWIGDVILKLE